MKAERVIVIIPAEVTVTSAEYLLMLLQAMEAADSTEKCETASVSAG